MKGRRSAGTKERESKVVCVTSKLDFSPEIRCALILFVGLFELAVKVLKRKMLNMCVILKVPFPSAGQPYICLCLGYKLYLFKRGEAGFNLVFGQ